MPVESLLLIALSVYCSLFLYTIGIRNLREPLHRTLALVFFFIIFWAIGDALMLGARSDFWVRVGIFLFSVAPIYTTLYLLIFTFKLTKIKVPKLFSWSIAAVAVGLTAHIIINDPLFDSFTVAKSSINSFVVNDLHYSIYSAYFSSFFMLSYIMILRQAFRQSGEERSRSIKIFWAALISSGAASLTNLLLPSFGTSALVWMGPIFTPAFIVVAVHAVAKNRLFEVRRIVIRSTYTAAVVVAAVIAQTVLAFAIRRFSADSIASDTTVVAIIFFVFGILFVYLWDRFRRKTTKYLYKDAYDSEEVLKALSNVVVTEHELDSLEDRSMSILVDALKPNFARLILLNSGGEYYREYNIGSSEGSVDAASLLQVLSRQSERVLFADHVDAEPAIRADNAHSQDQSLSALLANGLSASVRLEIKQETVGYLVLGAKLNHNPYTSQDYKLLTIASNELAIAIQNARRYDEIKGFNQTLHLEVEKATQQLRAATGEIEAQKHQIESIVSSINEAILGLDPSGVVVFANASAQNMLDSHDDPVGSKLSSLLNLEEESGDKVDLSGLLTNDSIGNSERTLVLRYSESDYLVVAVIVRVVSLNQGKRTGSVIVLRDITEQTSNQQKRHAYISLLFHELRTPLTYLEGQLSNLKLFTKDEHNEKLTSSVDEAHTQAVDLASIVNHLGEYVQADSTDKSVPEQEIDLAAVSNAIQDEYRSPAEDKGLELHVDTSALSGNITSNKIYVRTILTTLVDNAIKFTEKGQVLIRVSCTDKEVQVDVTDTGIGISKHHQQTIFKNNKQAEDFETRTAGGLGLSLYTASKYAEQLGAELTVDSKVGFGSTFSLKLPVK